MLALWGTGDVTWVNPAQWQLGKAPALEPELYKQLTSWKDGWLQNYTKQKQCFLTPHGITEYCKHCNCSKQATYTNVKCYLLEFYCAIIWNKKQTSSTWEFSVEQQSATHHRHLEDRYLLHRVLFSFHGGCMLDFRLFKFHQNTDNLILSSEISVHLQRDSKLSQGPRFQRGKSLRCPL